MQFSCLNIYSFRRKYCKAFLNRFYFKYTSTKRSCMHYDHNRSPIKIQLRLIARILFTSTCLAKDNICAKPPLCSKGRGQSCQTSRSASSSNEVQWSVESPFPVHVLPKKKKRKKIYIYIYLKTHYITVTLATLADYIIRHQWESWKRHTETPAEVIGCNSAWCWERSLWGSSKSLHLYSVFSPKKRGSISEDTW